MCGGGVRYILLLMQIPVALVLSCEAVVGFLPNFHGYISIT